MRVFEKRHAGALTEGCSQRSQIVALTVLVTVTAPDDDAEDCETLRGVYHRQSGSIAPIVPLA